MSCSIGIDTRIATLQVITAVKLEDVIISRKNHGQVLINHNLHYNVCDGHVHPNTDIHMIMTFIKLLLMQRLHCLQSSCLSQAC